MAVLFLGMITCKKETVAPPTVKVFEGAITITQTSASVAAEVTDQGGGEVQSRGFFYGLSGGSLDTVYCDLGDPVYSAELPNLRPNTQYVYEAFAKNAGGTGTSGKFTFTTQDIMMPTVETGEVGDVGSSTATCGGKVTDGGGGEVTERGVCWGTEQGPTVGDNHAASGQGMGEYSCAMAGLTGNTLYYVRAYAKNSKGTAYGEERTFTTLDYDLPEVTTAEISDIGQTTAKGGGEVTSGGGTVVTERGICWGSSHNPTIHNHKVASGQGLGVFECAFSGMSAHTKYYVRAYATNSRGTAYGNEVSFTTLADLPSVSTVGVTNVTTTTAKGRGKVLADGGAPVTERGICWGSSHNPTVANHCSSSGSGTGEYTVNMTGLAPQTTYYARAYATNGTGTKYGDEVSFTTLAVTVPVVTTSSVTSIGRTSARCGGSVDSDGGADVTERGVCWGTEHNPTVSGQHTPSGSGLGDFTCSITGLSVNTAYYVRAYAKNSKGTAYGEEKRFTTLDYDLPEVTTAEISDIGQTTAKGGGEVTGDGGTTVTERGICWGSSHNPTIHNHKVESGQGLGSFVCNISGMSAHTKYYVRAYAINSRGTAYGDEVSFTTLAELPTVLTGSVTNIGATTATGSGNVTSDGGATVTERGVCWSTGHNPTINGSHDSNGTGTGNYTVNMAGLTPNTTYYVRAYAKNSQGTAYGEEVNFTTSQAIVYTIGVSANPSNGGSVTGGGTYEQGQSCTVTATAATGFNFQKWTENGSQVSTNASYTFTVSGNRNLVAVFQTGNYAISATANPTNGGTITGTGSYNYGQSCTLTATPATGYTFVNWTKNGTQVSTDASYTFTVTAAAAYVAHFQAINYTISVSASPNNGGTVSGGGTYSYGQSCTVHAYANSGYTFTKWTVNGAQFSTNADYTFTVTSNRNLVANFTYTPQAPTGALDGMFSVSATQQVWFSQGNLQYRASTNTWRLADNQWDHVGEGNTSISQYYSGWIDLFGWGTSGWNCGNIYYRPWDSNNSCPYCYGPPGNYNLTGSYASSDWGYYNTISNGGNMAQQWRTLTQSEWDYVFNSRVTSTGIRYAKAQVNNVNGVILLPDNWSSNYYTLYSINSSTTSFTSNVISSSTWTNSLQSHGAVFLPAVGYRDGTSFNGDGHGFYWSASSNGNNNAYNVSFGTSNLGVSYSNGRNYGYSVRLVRNVQ